MKYEVVANSCRVCLTRSKKLRSLYKPLDDEEEAPNKMLQQITGICLEKAGDVPMLPKSICRSCELSLSMAFQFRVKALKTQRILELYLKHQSDKQQGLNEDLVQPLCVKEELEELMEMQELDEVEEDVQVLEGEMVEELDNSEALRTEEEFRLEATEEEKEGTEEEEEGTEGEEYVEETLFELRGDGDGDGDGEDVFESTTTTAFVEQCGEKKEEAEELKENKLSSVQRKSKENQRTIRVRATRKTKVKSKSPEKHKSPTKAESMSLKKNQESSKRGRKPKRVDEEWGHICDICGNIYAKRGRMMEHRRRHDKELRFACELCDKRFHLREMLRKHMFSHSGGKPLKCNYCTRTFYYESVRKAHEAVHKGHKPYVCDVCNKPFGYAHALKKHKLIHADIKLFHCSYCDKDFRLQHHMKQHVLTKMHQNAVRLAECGELESAHLTEDDEAVDRHNAEVDLEISTVATPELQSLLN